MNLGEKMARTAGSYGAAPGKSMIKIVVGDPDQHDKAAQLSPRCIQQRQSRQPKRQGTDQRQRQIKTDALSGIILGNNSADDQIPKDARGRFILQDGTVFQGYLFDEGRL